MDLHEVLQFNREPDIDDVLQREHDTEIKDVFVDYLERICAAFEEQIALRVQILHEPDTDRAAIEREIRSLNEKRKCYIDMVSVYKEFKTVGVS